jgi:putative endonuclease
LEREFLPTVYLLANRSDLHRRDFASDPANPRAARGAITGFTREPGIKRLVWFEQHATMEQAILREKRIKKWLRRWKIELIE